MTLKTASKINVMLAFVVWLIMLPFSICGKFIEYIIAKPLMWVIDTLDNIRWKMGHWLLVKSEEANNGTIKNESMLKSLTAYSMYKLLKSNDKL